MLSQRDQRLGKPLLSSVFAKRESFVVRVSLWLSLMNQHSKTTPGTCKSPTGGAESCHGVGSG